MSAKTNSQQKIWMNALRYNFLYLWKLQQQAVKDKDKAREWIRGLDQ